MTTESLPVADGKYSVPYADQGSGDAIVLLPGGGLDVSYLAPVADALENSGRRVVRVGIRHPIPDDGTTFTMHDLAGDVVAVMDEVGVDRAWVGGHAFGNRLARTVALDAPKRVDGLILLAAGGTVQPSDAAERALRVVFADVSDGEGVAAMRYMVGDPFDAEAAWKAVQQARDPEMGAMEREAVIATPQQEWASIAPGIPVLIIQGTNDQIAPTANGEELKKQAPDQVTLEWIDGGGHLFALLQPKETAQAILSHLDGDSSDNGD